MKSLWIVLELMALHKFTESRWTGEHSRKGSFVDLHHLAISSKIQIFRSVTDKICGVLSKKFAWPGETRKNGFRFIQQFGVIYFWTVRVCDVRSPSYGNLWQSSAGKNQLHWALPFFFCLNVSFLREGKKLEHFLKLISCAKYQYYTTCMPSPTGSSGLLSWLCWWVCFIPWQIQGLLLQISRRIRGYWESIDFAQVFFLSIPRYRVGKFLQVSTDILVKYESTG